MAKVPFRLGLMLGLQNDVDDLNDSVVNATDISEVAAGVDPAAGGILGAAGNGIGDSGVAVTFERDGEEIAPLGLTVQTDDLLGVNVTGFSVAWNAKGSGTPSPSADADYRPPPAVDALLQAGGLESLARGGPDGWLYQPGTAPGVVTCQLRIADLRWVFANCGVSLAWSGEPGSAGVWTATIQPGRVEDFTSPGFWGSLDYGTLASLAAPPLQGIGHTFAGNARGWNGNANLVLDNSLEEIGDTNASDGFVVQPQARDWRFRATMFADDADQTVEYDDLERQGIAVTNWSFRAGTTVNPGGAPVPEAYQMAALFANAKTLVPQEVGGSLAWDLDMRFEAGTENQEFLITFD